MGGFETEFRYNPGAVGQIAATIMMTPHANSLLQGISDALESTHDRLRLNANLGLESKVRMFIGPSDNWRRAFYPVAMHAGKRRDEGPSAFFPLTRQSKRELQEAHGLPGTEFVRRLNSAHQKDSRRKKDNPAI